MSEDDRPSVRRIPASGVHVAITLDDTSEHNLWSDVTGDVAHGGVFVATYHPLGIGTVVHLLLTLDGEDVPLAAEGVVRWHSLHRDGSDNVAGAGIKLLELDEAASQKLARFAREVREPLVFELDDAPMRKKRSSA
jgi:uncharacterized protein (TIGR02266 family)